MNKLFAALMTAMILGTVAVVFVLGVMSLGGLPKKTTPEAEQVTLDSALTYGTDFTDWQYLNSARQTQWRCEKATIGRSSVRLRRILSESLQVHALEQDKGLVVRAYQRTVCQRVETEPPALRRRSRWPRMAQGRIRALCPSAVVGRFLGIRRGRRPEHMGVASRASNTAISGRLTMTSALDQSAVLVPALSISMALA